MIDFDNDLENIIDLLIENQYKQEQRILALVGRISSLENEINKLENFKNV